MDISRWCQPPDSVKKNVRPSRGAGTLELVLAMFHHPCRGGFIWAGTGGWHHRLICEQPSGFHRNRRLSGFHRNRRRHKNDREDGGKRRQRLRDGAAKADGHAWRYSVGSAQQARGGCGARRLRCFRPGLRHHGNRICHRWWNHSDGLIDCCRVRLAQSHRANPNSRTPLIAAPSITLAGRYSNLTACGPGDTATD